VLNFLILDRPIRDYRMLIHFNQFVLISYNILWLFGSWRFYKSYRPSVWIIGNVFFIKELVNCDLPGLSYHL